MTAARAIPKLALVYDEPAVKRCTRQLRAERDRTLDALQHGRRKAVIDLAVQIARELCASGKRCNPSWLVPRGCVTGTDVLDEMRERGLLTEEESKNPRWLGGALLPSRGFVRVGYAPCASKGRPAAVWAVRGEVAIGGEPAT